MVAHVTTVAFLGLEARSVDVQVQIAKGGINAFNVVGLPDKAVNESKERVRAALSAIGLALPFQRITVNLSPADLPKEGAISISRSRSGCWRRWARSMPRRSANMW